MTINRRFFIRDSIFAAGAVLIPGSVERVTKLAMSGNDLFGYDPHLITIHHSAHHRGVHPGFEGVSGGLLADAGNFLRRGASTAEHQEMISKMNKAGYHVATLGDTELDMHPDELAALTEHMRFPLVNGNLSFEGTSLAGRVKPYVILPYGSYKIGVTAVSATCSLTGIAQRLRSEGCQLVICLSSMTHLSDQIGLAKANSGVDLILASNSASFQTGPYIAKDALGEEVAISQGCANGSYLRQLQLSMRTAFVALPALA